MFFWVLTGLIFFSHRGITQINNPPTCCDYPGWSHFQPITFNNASGNAVTAGTPYVFYFNTAALVSAGKMQASGNDLRILDSPCGTSIPYCIEAGINTPQTEIWINLPAIGPNASVTLYLYYGNPGAAAGSNCGAFFSNNLTIAANQALSGTQIYDRITINAGVTVTLNAQQPLIFQAKKINILGTINGNNRGYAPGAGPGAGTSGSGSIGGGGGGYGGNGGRGGVPSNAGPAYGTANGPDIDMGSGGGGSDCAPSAAGGGMFSATAVVIDMNGTIDMNGQSAAGCLPNPEESEGGGSGGGVLLQGIYINGNGAINCRGGNGANSIDKEGGGGGGGGRVKRFYLLAPGGGINIDVTPGNAGNGGQTNMQGGQLGTNQAIVVPGVTVALGSESPITPLPVADFSTPGGLCENTIAQFTDLSTVPQGTIQSWAWNFGSLGVNSGLQNPSVTASSCGQITVSLTVTTNGGCMANATRDLEVTGQPTIGFVTTPACVGQPILFNETVNFSSANCNDNFVVTYDYGDGTPAEVASDPSHTFPGNLIGPYNVQATVTTASGCTASAINPITLFQSPQVSFIISNNPECVGNNVNLQSSTVITPPATITSRSWDFGDGTPTANTANVIHVYNTAGTFDIVLTETTNQNCSASSTQQITILPNPAPDFSTDLVCEGQITSFTNLTPNAGNLSFTWNMPNPVTQYTDVDPQHQFASAAGSPFNVTLIASNALGCTGQITKPVEVSTLPVAEFSFGNVCFPDAVVFQNASIASPGSTFNWDFGNGDSSSDSDPIYQYPQPGNYTVDLTVIAGTCSDNISYPIIIYPKPQADFSYSSTVPCVGVEYQFLQQAQIGGGGTLQSFLWEFNGFPISASDPVYAFSGPNPDPGYLVKLIATSADQCKDTITKYVPVHPMPLPSFTAPSVCDGEYMQFNSTSTITSGTINSYLYDFGDSFTSALATDSHLYNGAGTFAVELTVVSDQNCEANITTPVVVNPNPEAAFIVERPEGCDPHTSIFLDNSTPNAPPNQVVDWQWDFSTETFSGNAPNPVTYNTGTYSVKLTVTSIDGCVDSVTQTDVIIVHPLPEAGLTTDPYRTGILNPSFSFFNNSTGWDNCIIEYGDGSIQQITQMNQHMYNDTGLYQVTLTAISEFGCIDTIVRFVRVLPEYTYFVPNAFTPNFDLKNEFWKGKGMAMKTYEMQIFNRWGEEIFRSKNPDEHWDGTLRIFGSEAKRMTKQDVYSYRVSILDNNDLRHIYTGKIVALPDTEKNLAK